MRLMSAANTLIVPFRERGAEALRTVVATISGKYFDVRGSETDVCFRVCRVCQLTVSSSESYSILEPEIETEAGEAG